MLSTPLLTALLLAPLALSLPPHAHIAAKPSTTSTPTATCSPSYYPGSLTSLPASQTFYARVFSNNPAYDGHNIQLRPSDPAALAVVDDQSPVLALNLHAGRLTAVSGSNARSPPLGGLRNITSTRQNGKAAFIFRGLQGAGQSFTESVNGWLLLGGGTMAEYNLYHDVTDGYVNGFVICQASDRGGSFGQLFYYDYLREPPAMPGCDFVGLQTTIAPYVGS